MKKVNGHWRAPHLPQEIPAHVRNKAMIFAFFFCVAVCSAHYKLAKPLGSEKPIFRAVLFTVNIFGLFIFIVTTYLLKNLKKEQSE